jgi:hypothetical protein
MGRMTQPVQQMERETRIKLLGLYRDEVTRLESLLDRSLSQWKT